MTAIEAWRSPAAPDREACWRSPCACWRAREPLQAGDRDDCARQSHASGTSTDQASALRQGRAPSRSRLTSRRYAPAVRVAEFGAAAVAAARAGLRARPSSPKRDRTAPYRRNPPPAQMRRRVRGLLSSAPRRHHSARDPSDPPHQGRAERRRRGGWTLSRDLDERVSSPRRVGREASVGKFRHWDHRPRPGFFPGS
jgi:hypothetical protein